MTETRWADVRIENGHQIIVLPGDIRLDADKVAIQHDDTTGEVTIKPSTPHPYWQALFAKIDALPVSDEDLDEYLTDRPLNFPIDRDLFGDEDRSWCDTCWTLISRVT